MNRGAIYFFYDKDGVVDEYVSYFLESLQPFCSEIIIVVNGQVNELGYQVLQKYAKTVLVRSNYGLDFYAYKEAIEYFGYNKIKDFDELILCNFTFFGPIHPLSKMFKIMKSKQCDIWGPYKDTIKKISEQGDALYHILPSFFIVYRQSILNSPFFKEYWGASPEITSYFESVIFHEQKQSLFFEEKGFISDCYIDNTKYKACWQQQWSTIHPDRLMIEDNYPFLKRRHFYVKDATLFNHIKTYGFYKTIKYIQSQTDYNIDLIYENINRTQDLTKLGKNKPSRIKFYKRLILSKLIPIPSKRKYYKEKLFYDPYNTKMISYQDFLKVFYKNN